MEQSSAAQIIVAIIPIAGIVMGAVVVFFYLYWNYRRRIMLIKAGHFNKPEFDLLSYSLLSGLLLTSVGVVLTVFLAVALAISEIPLLGLLGGLIPLTMGVGFLAYYGIKRGDRVK